MGTGLMTFAIGNSKIDRSDVDEGKAPRQNVFFHLIQEDVKNLDPRATTHFCR